MPSPMKFQFPEGYDPKRLFDELAHHYYIKKDRSSGKNIAIYDTFDWRLYHRSLVLYRSRNAFYVRKLFEDTTICGTRIPSPPLFVRDFPDSKLKEHLVPIIRNRALIRVVEVSSRETPYDFLKPDGTVLARLVLEELGLSGGKEAKGSAACLWLKPAGEPPREFQTLKNRLEKIGFVASRKAEVYFTALEAIGIKPGSYSTKFTAAIDPAMRSDETMKLILHFLLQVMRINEGNIEKDPDTEFLHDFRVALRRARSALSEMGQVFPPEVTDRFEKVLVTVGRISNPLRDLDVYLQDESNHKAMLPAALHNDIDPLFKYLRKERTRAFRDLVQHLRSKKYRKGMGTWRTFLNEKFENSLAAPDAGLPIGEMARIRILRKYRRIVEKGNSALVNPKDKKLHLLRLACKELRYLLEFFASMFPREKVDVVIQQLKKLQDLLGHFNDLRIQEEYLLSVAGELPRRGKTRTRTLLAIGSLIGTLDREKQTAKEAFAKTFNGYASLANQELFQKLVAGPIPATPSRSSNDLP